MKPWEENWMTEEGDVIATVSDRGVECIFDESCEASKAVHEPRARLAAAAPDMARVLLALEHLGQSRGDHNMVCAYCANCLGCYVDGLDVPPHESEGHAPDCALYAALRKAGAR